MLFAQDVSDYGGLKYRLVPSMENLLFLPTYSLNKGTDVSLQLMTTDRSDRYGTPYKSNYIGAELMQTLVKRHLADAIIGFGEIIYADMSLSIRFGAGAGAFHLTEYEWVLDWYGDEDFIEAFNITKSKSVMKYALISNELRVEQDKIYMSFEVIYALSSEHRATRLVAYDLKTFSFSGFSMQMALGFKI